MSDLKNQLAKRANAPVSEGTTIKSLLAKDNVKRRFEEILGQKAAGFMSSVINVVNGNTNLKECDPNSVLASAAVAASLDLPIDPNLGFAYIVPYKQKGVPKAQFQIGYKGFIQLAMRTGQYKTMNATEVYEGEIKSHNRITGELEFDFEGRKSDKVIGYVAYFRLINGFEKYWYMTREEVDQHAKRYSQTYKRGFGKWTEDFDAMALKTVLKLLLSKYGILSIEMQTSLKADQAVINTNDNDASSDFSYDYIDTEGNIVTESDDIEIPDDDLPEVIA